MNKPLPISLSGIMAILPLPAMAALSKIEPQSSAQAAPSKATYPRVGDTLESLTSRFGPGKKNAGKIRIPGKDKYLLGDERLRR